MPVQACQRDGKSGHRWGAEGYCYTGAGSRAKALAQGRAIEASKDDVYKMKVQTLVVKAALELREGESIEDLMNKVRDALSSVYSNVDWLWLERFEAAKFVVAVSMKDDFATKYYEHTWARDTDDNFTFGDAVEMEPVREFRPKV